MNATLSTRIALLAAACAVTFTLLMGVGTMAKPNAAEAWVAKAAVTSSQS